MVAPGNLPASHLGGMMRRKEKKKKRRGAGFERGRSIGSVKTEIEEDESYEMEDQRRLKFAGIQPLRSRTRSRGRSFHQDFNPYQQGVSQRDRSRSPGPPIEIKPLPPRRAEYEEAHQKKLRAQTAADREKRREMERAAAGVKDTPQQRMKDEMRVANIQRRKRAAQKKNAAAT